LHFKKYRVKKEIKKRIISRLDKAELVLLKFSKDQALSELIWEHSKEFEYHNQMYDVVETETLGDSIFYWCWWDHEETKLNKELSAWVLKTLGKDPQNKENRNELIDFYKQLFYVEPGYDKVHFKINIAQKQFQYHPSIQDWINTTPSPPPKV